MATLATEREFEVESYLVKRCKEKRLWPIKFSSSSETGMPDRLILCPGGRILWIELKRPVGGRLSAIQIVRHNQLRQLGFDVYVINSKEAVDELINNI